MLKLKSFGVQTSQPLKLLEKVCCFTPTHNNNWASFIPAFLQVPHTASDPEDRA